MLSWPYRSVNLQKKIYHCISLAWKGQNVEGPGPLLEGPIWRHCVFVEYGSSRIKILRLETHLVFEYTEIWLLFEYYTTVCKFRDLVRHSDIWLFLVSMFVIWEYFGKSFTISFVKQLKIQDLPGTYLTRMPRGHSLIEIAPKVQDFQSQWPQHLNKQKKNRWNTSIYVQ